MVNILNDAEFIAKLKAGANVFHEYTELMDQVAERMELLINEAGAAGSDSTDYQEELQRIEDEQRLTLGVIAQDFNTIVKLAVDAGVPAEKIRSMVVSKMATENPALGAASGRAAF